MLNLTLTLLSLRKGLRGHELSRGSGDGEDGKEVAHFDRFNLIQFENNNKMETVGCLGYIDSFLSMKNTPLQWEDGIIYPFRCFQWHEHHYFTDVFTYSGPATCQTQINLLVTGECAYICPY